MNVVKLFTIVDDIGWFSTTFDNGGDISLSYELTCTLTLHYECVNIYHDWCFENMLVVYMLYLF